MEAIQFREILDITMAPAVKIDHYNNLYSKYNKLIFRGGLKKPIAPPDMSLDASSEEAKIAVMSVFRSMKRGLGYG